MIRKEIPLGVDRPRHRYVARRARRAPVVSDIGGEAAAVPSDDALILPAVEPGRAATSTNERRAGAHRSP